MRRLRPSPVSAPELCRPPKRPFPWMLCAVSQCGSLDENDLGLCQLAPDSGHSIATIFSHARLSELDMTSSVRPLRA